MVSSVIMPVLQKVLNRAKGYFAHLQVAQATQEEHANIRGKAKAVAGPFHLPDPVKFVR